jgi:translation elongation factor P/translation initiation factor 5A
MDLDSFESIDMPYMAELKGQLAPEQQIEYWDIEGVKTLMRIFS